MALRRIIEIIIRDADLDRHRRKAKTVFGDIAGMGRNAARGLQQVFTGLGATLGAFVTGGLFAGLFLALGKVASAFREAAAQNQEFERQLARTQSLVDDAEVSMRALRRAVIQVARETGIERVRLADALFQLISAGLGAANALDVLRSTAKAAVVDQTDVKIVLEGVRAALNGFGLDASKAADVVETLFVIVRNNTTTFQEIGGSIGRVAPLARSLNVSLQETVSAMGAITQSGASTETAFVQLRGIFTAFIRQAGAFRRVGIDITRVLSERGLAGAFDEIREKIGTSTEALQPFFQNSRIITGVLALLGAQADTFSKNLSDMETRLGNIDTAFRETGRTVNQLSNLFREEWGAAMDRAGGQLNRFKSLLLEVGISVLQFFRTEAEKTLAVLERINAPVEVVNTVRLRILVDEAESDVEDLTEKVQELQSRLLRDIAELRVRYARLGATELFTEEQANTIVRRLERAFEIGGATARQAFIEELGDLQVVFQQLETLPDGLERGIARRTIEQILTAGQDFLDFQRTLEGATERQAEAEARLNNVLAIRAEITRLLAEGADEADERVQALRRGLAAIPTEIKPEFDPEPTEEMLEKIDRASRALRALRAGFEARTSPAFVRPLLSQLGRLESSLNRALDLRKQLQEAGADQTQIEFAERLIGLFQTEIGRLRELRDAFSDVAEESDRLAVQRIVEAGDAVVEAAEQSKAFADVLERQRQLIEQLDRVSRARLQAELENNSEAASAYEQVEARIKDALASNRDFIGQFPELQRRLQEFIEAAGDMMFDVGVELNETEATAIANAALQGIIDTFEQRSARIKLEAFLETGDLERAKAELDALTVDTLGELERLAQGLRGLGPVSEEAIAAVLAQIQKLKDGIGLGEISEPIRRAIEQIETTFDTARAELEIEVAVNPEVNEQDLQDGLARLARTAIIELEALRAQIDRTANPQAFARLTQEIGQYTRFITQANNATSQFGQRLSALQPVIRTFGSLVEEAFDDSPVASFVAAVADFVAALEGLESAVAALRDAREAFELLSGAAETTADSIEDFGDVAGAERVAESAEQAREAMEALGASAEDAGAKFLASFSQVAAVVGGVFGVISAGIGVVRTFGRLFGGLFGGGQQQDPRVAQRAAEERERETTRMVEAIKRNTASITAKLDELIAKNERIGANLTAAQREAGLGAFEEFNRQFAEIVAAIQDIVDQQQTQPSPFAGEAIRRLFEQMGRDWTAFLAALADIGIIDDETRDEITALFEALTEIAPGMQERIISAMLEGGEAFDDFLRDLLANTNLTDEQRRFIEDTIGSFGDGIGDLFDQLERQFGQFPRTLEGALSRFELFTRLLGDGEEALADFLAFLTTPDAFGNVVLDPETNAEFIALLQEFVAADEAGRRELIDQLRDLILSGEFEVAGFTANDLLRLLDPFIAAAGVAGDALGSMPSAIDRALEAIEIFRQFISDDPFEVARFALDQLGPAIDTLLQDIRDSKGEVPAALEALFAPLEGIEDLDPAAAQAVLEDVLRQIGELLLAGDFLGLTEDEFRQLADAMLRFRFELDSAFAGIPSAIDEALDAFDIFSRFVSDDPAEQLQFLIDRLKTNIGDLIDELTGAGQGVPQAILDLLAPLEGLEDLSTEEAQAEIDRILEAIGRALIENTDLFGLNAEQLNRLAESLARFRQGLEDVKVDLIGEAFEDLSRFSRFVTDDVQANFNRLFENLFETFDALPPELAAILEEARNLNLADPAQQERLRVIVESLFNAFAREGQTFGLEEDQFIQLLEGLSQFANAQVPDPQGFERTAATIRRTLTEVQGAEIIVALFALLDRARQIFRRLNEPLIVRFADDDAAIDIDVAAPDVTVPDVEAPEVNVTVVVPEVRVPEVAVEVQPPPAPEVTVNVEPPAVEVPEVQVPPVEVPEVEVPEAPAVDLTRIELLMREANAAVESLLADLGLQVAPLELIPDLLEMLPERLAFAIQRQQDFGGPDAELPTPVINVRNEITINESDADVIARQLAADVRRTLTRGFRPR